MGIFSKENLDAARGLSPADLVFRNAAIFNPFTCSFERGNLAVKNGFVLGIGTYEGNLEYDVSGSYIIPGLIDAHVHIESSLLVPSEYARLAALHGTTTVIADPHELANVAGVPGIDFMLDSRAGAVIDIQYLLPSCVPSTPGDVGGATLTAQDLEPYIGRVGILGLGEMMDVFGVLDADPSIGEKLRLFPVRDGHAPRLSGNDLNAYIFAGLQSDHECTGREEAEEKLSRGMYIYIREGSTEQNIANLIGLVNRDTVSRCCFASDDCKADTLFLKGHIDNCIRKATGCGLELNLALRMATLSAADRFGLSDRGALTPGRRADLCIVDDLEQFIVRSTFVRGTEIFASDPSVPHSFPSVLPSAFPSKVPSADAIRIHGTGKARVIGLVPHQILTDSLRFDLNAREIPDVSRDILKLVLCNRYIDKRTGVGLVHGFSLKRGAIASSVSHDAHNIIAVGTSDTEIRTAIDAVIRSGGAMVTVVGKTKTILPLRCGGLMSALPWPEVVEHALALDVVTRSMGSINDPFMYLSFLALTVIPALRITDRGLFDTGECRFVPLFLE